MSVIKNIKEFVTGSKEITDYIKRYFSLMYRKYGKMISREYDRDPDLFCTIGEEHPFELRIVELTVYKYNAGSNLITMHNKVVLSLELFDVHIGRTTEFNVEDTLYGLNQCGITKEGYDTLTDSLIKQIIERYRLEYSRRKE